MSEFKNSFLNRHTIEPKEKNSNQEEVFLYSKKMLKSFIFPHTQALFTLVNEKNFFTKTHLSSYILISHVFHYYYVLILSFIFLLFFVIKCLSCLEKKKIYI